MNQLSFYGGRAEREVMAERGKSIRGRVNIRGDFRNIKGLLLSVV